MILLITASSRAKECAAALEHGTGHKTQLASSIPQALNRLQAAEYESLVVDQSLLEVDFRALDTLLNHAGMAIPVYINLALQSSDRVVREVQVALRRVDSEKLLAMRSAERILSNQLRNNLTGILLNSELALRQGSIPPEVAEKVKSVRGSGGTNAYATEDLLSGLRQVQGRRMRNIVVDCALSGYAGFILGVFLMSLLATGQKAGNVSTRST